MSFLKRHSDGQSFPVDKSGVAAGEFKSAAIGDAARQVVVAAVPALSKLKVASSPYDQSDKAPFVTLETTNGYGGGTVDFESGYSLPIPEFRKMGLGDKMVIKATPAAITYYLLDSNGSVRERYRLPDGRRKANIDRYVYTIKTLDKDVKKDPTQYFAEDIAEMRGPWMRTLSILSPAAAKKLQKRR